MLWSPLLNAAGKCKDSRAINNNNNDQFINILVRIHDMTCKPISLIFSSWEYNKCLVLLFCSVQFICSVMSNSLLSHGLQHTRLPCSSPTPGACSNSCPSSWWCHPTIASSVFPFSSCLQSFPVSQFFASGSQSIGVSASASVLPMNIQDWFPLGWTVWIFLQTKGLSRVVSNTTV